MAEPKERYEYNYITKVLMKNSSVSATIEDLNKDLEMLEEKQRIQNMARSLAEQIKNNGELKRVQRVLASTNAGEDTKELDNRITDTAQRIANITAIKEKIKQGNS